MNLLHPARGRFAALPEGDVVPDTGNRSFGRGVPSIFTHARSVWSPAVNLREADGEFVLTAELPGMEADEIEVDVREDVLTLAGEKRTETKTIRSGHDLMVERAQVRFERSFTLPGSVDGGAVHADVRDGRLTVHLPKRVRPTGHRIATETRHP